jgi:hypothetical protein
LSAQLLLIKIKSGFFYHNNNIPSVRVPHMSCIKYLNIKFINKSAFKRICNLNNMKEEKV